jgi:hypothetical protein
MKKDLLGIPSIVFVGENLEDDTWMSESQKSEIPELINQLKDLNPHPKVYIAFKYGGNAFKSTIVGEGFDDVSVWEHGTLFASGGTLQTHLFSMSKNSKKIGVDPQPSVESLAWSPPTLNWLNKNCQLGNLRLKVGAFEEIVKMKGAVNEAIRSGRTKCFNIKPHSSLIDNEDVWFRTRAITLYMCQECSKDLRDISRSTFMGWYFVSKKQQLTEVTNDIKGQSGRIVIWLDVDGGTIQGEELHTDLKELELSLHFSTNFDDPLLEEEDLVEIDKNEGKDKISKLLPQNLVELLDTQDFGEELIKTQTNNDESIKLVNEKLDKTEELFQDIDNFLRKKQRTDQQHRQIMMQSLLFWNK